jgi:hypothetical protein
MVASAKLPPALKHGAYSTATLLPGEDKAAFARLHESLTAELAPEGALEEHIVANLARFVWRRENLTVLRVAKVAHDRILKLVHQRIIGIDDDDAARAAAQAKVRKGLGQVCELVDAQATESRLSEEIEVRAGLDEMIDKCLKRLLFVRGLKSMGRPAAVTRLAQGAEHELPPPRSVETLHAVSEPAA